MLSRSPLGWGLVGRKVLTHLEVPGWAFRRPWGVVLAAWVLASACSALCTASWPFPSPCPHVRSLFWPLWPLGGPPLALQTLWRELGCSAQGPVFGIGEIQEMSTSVLNMSGHPCPASSVSPPQPQPWGRLEISRTQQAPHWRGVSRPPS